jgi:hypothetical protein
MDAERLSVQPAAFPAACFDSLGFRDYAFGARGTEIHAGHRAAHGQSDVAAQPTACLSCGAGSPTEYA